MKTTIFTLIAILICAFSFAQTLNDWDKNALDKLMNKSPYIFVGKAISSKAFKTIGGRIATSVILDVTEVIKGNISKGTVEIVIPGGAIDNEQTVIIDGIQIPESDAIYFTNNAGKLVLNSKIANSNNLTLESNSILSFNKDNEITGKYYVIWGSFKKVTEVYDYLEKNYGLKVAPSLYEKKNQKSTEIKNNVIEEVAKKFVYLHT